MKKDKINLAFKKWPVYFINTCIIILLSLDLFLLWDNYKEYNLELVDANKAHQIAQKELEQYCAKFQIRDCNNFETSGPRWQNELKLWMVGYKNEFEKHNIAIFVYRDGRTGVNVYKDSDHK